MSLPYRGLFSKGGFGAAGNTVINVLIPPKNKCFTVIVHLRYFTLTTSHTITVLRPLAKVKLTTAATAAQTTVVMPSDPGTLMLGPSGSSSRLANQALSTGDWLVFETPDGSFYFDKVATPATGYPGNVTMTSNVPTGGFPVGTTVWDMGAAGYKDPVTAEAFQTIVPATGSIQDIVDVENGLFATQQTYQPIMLQSSNGTNPGTFDLVRAVYSSVG